MATRWSALWTSLSERLHLAPVLAPASGRDLRAIALENLAHGLCFFDTAGRLIMCNRRFRDLYNLGPTAAWPTMPLTELLQTCSEAGAQVDRWSSEIVQRQQLAPLQSQEATYHDVSATGRIIAVRCRWAREGWVVTFDDVTEQHQTEAWLRQLAHQDPLTGLANRVSFGARLKAALAEAQTGRLAAVFCLDLDRFKQVNDRLGHHAGDALLQQVAARLRTSLDPTELPARLGGDEFAVLSTRCRSEERAKLTGVRLVKALCHPYVVDGAPVDVGASIGVALAPLHATDADALVRAADTALRRAKREGRGTCRIYRCDHAVHLA